MKKNRLIFYSIFALFHLISFIFTVVLDNNTSLLFKMVGWVPSFKWVTLLGLIMVIVDFLWARSVQKETEKEKDALTLELNTLKAKLFDLQEAAKNVSIPKPSGGKPSGNLNP
jgi:hypothetical protein